MKKERTKAEGRWKKDAPYGIVLPLRVGIGGNEGSAANLSLDSGRKKERIGENMLMFGR